MVPIFSDAEKKLPASVLFHRALISLIPAGVLAIAAYDSGFAWYFAAPAVLFLGIGIRYLKLGSDRWNETQR
jgi:hypothetical protein